MKMRHPKRGVAYRRVMAVLFGRWSCIQPRFIRRDRAGTWFGRRSLRFGWWKRRTR